MLISLGQKTTTTTTKKTNKEKTSKFNLNNTKFKMNVFEIS